MISFEYRELKMKKKHTKMMYCSYRIDIIIMWLKCSFRNIWILNEFVTEFHISTHIKDEKPQFLGHPDTLCWYAKEEAFTN